MTEAQLLHRVDGLAEVAHDDYVMVLNLPRLEQQQVPYRFEGTAFEIWTRIDGTRTEAGLIDELADLYGASPEEVAQGVKGFLAQMRELGLVRDVE